MRPDIVTNYSASEVVLGEEAKDGWTAPPQESPYKKRRATNEYTEGSAKFKLFQPYDF